MSSPRLIPPWVIFGVVALIVAVTAAWSALNRPESPPDMHERHAVQEQLRQVEGIRPALPVTLPRGYDFARWYEHDTSSSDDGSESLDEKTDGPADSWSVYFFPTDGPREDGLPVVIFCVQRPGIRDVLCGEQNDATHLRRQLGQNDVLISRVSPGRRDMAAWRDVELTTDLNKVTWLR